MSSRDEGKGGAWAERALEEPVASWSQPVGDRKSNEVGRRMRGHTPSSIASKLRDTCALTSWSLVRWEMREQKLIIQNREWSSTCGEQEQCERGASITSAG